MRRLLLGMIVIGVMTLTGVSASAFPSFGNQVDQYCTEVGGTPSMPYNGDCATCHNQSDPGADRTLLFAAYKAGDFDAFCPPEANSPPFFEPVGDLMMTEDGLLTLDVFASDPDGDFLILEAANLPMGAVFEDWGMGEGRLVWMPTFDQAGNYLVTFIATDSGSPPMTAMEEITITVGNFNRPPILTSIGAQTIAVGATLRIPLLAEDPDGDGLEFGSAGLPVGASLTDFGGGAGEVVWTPSLGDVGSVTVTVTVTDSGLPMESDAEEFVMTVGAVNQPPVLDLIGDRSVQEGETISIGLSASDPNGDVLRFECVGGPAGFETLDAGNGTARLTGTAGFDDAGNHEVMCTVFDSAVPAAIDSETFTLTIGDANRPPVLDPIGMTKDGDSIVLRLTAHDVDGNDLFFEASGMPDGAEFVDHGDGSAEFVWTPAADLYGEFMIHFTVTDNGIPTESTSADFTIPLVAPELVLPSVSRARWNGKRGLLRMAGAGAIPRDTIDLVDAVTGVSLVGVVADDRGRFRVTVRLDASAVPCTVSAVGRDGTGEARPIAHAPANCTMN
jgi:hypothetical protein